MPEVRLAQEPRHQDEGEVRNRLGAVTVAVGTDGQSPGVKGIRILLADRSDVRNDPHQSAVGRYDGQPGRKDRLQIVRDKCLGGGRGLEHLDLDAESAVIQFSVQPGEMGRQVRIAGADEAPNFTANGTAFGLVKVPVIPRPRKRGTDPPLVVIEEIAVVEEIVPAPVLPELRQVLGRQEHAPLLQGFQPHDLDIKIVIRGHFLGPQPVQRQVVPELVVLQRRADHAADGLANPAGQNLIFYCS